MKILLTVLCLLFGTVYGQTIGYMRYDTVKIFTTKPGGRGSLDVTGNVRFTGLLQKSAGTDSVVVRDVNGNLGTTAKGALFTTPTWQQTLTAGSTLTGNNTVNGGANTFELNNTTTLTLKSTSNMLIESRAGFGAHPTSSMQSTTSTLELRSYDDGGAIGDYQFTDMVSGTGTHAVRWDNTTKQLTYADTTTGSSGLTVGTTTIASGTDTRVLYNNAGVLGEYPLSTFVAGGTGAANQVAYFTGAGAISGRSSFTDDGSTITMAPTTTVLFNTNSGSIAQFQRNAATSSFTQWDVVQPGGTQANGDGFSVLAMGSAYATSGLFEADAAILLANAQLSAGFNIATSHASAPIKLWTAGTLWATLSTAGALRLHSYGAGTATFDASGNITSVSDTRLKNVQGYSYVGLKEVMKIKPINYKWNEKSGNELLHTYTGFSAQNVKENIPNGTGVMPDGYLTLQDRAILAAAINAVKELKELNDKQQKEIDKLKEEVKKLKIK